MSSATEIDSERCIQDFILDHFTVPLACKLAVAAFMDLRHSQMQGFETRNTIYNEGGIISDMQLPGKPAVPEISDSLNYGSRQWRSFMSVLFAAWKRLFAR